MWFWEKVNRLPYGYETHEFIYEFAVLLGMGIIKCVAVHKDRNLASRLRSLADNYDTRP